MASWTQWFTTIINTNTHRNIPVSSVHLRTGRRGRIFVFLRCGGIRWGEGLLLCPLFSVFVGLEMRTAESGLIVKKQRNYTVTHTVFVCVCVCVCTMCVWNSGTLWCSRCFRRRGPVGGARPWKLRLYSVSTGTGFFLKGGTDLLLEWSSCRGVKGHLHQSVKSKSRELNESLNHFNNSIQVSSVTQQPAVIIDQLFFSWGEPAHKQSAAPLWTCSWTTGV